MPTYKYVNIVKKNFFFKILKNEIASSEAKTEVLAFEWNTMGNSTTDFIKTGFWVSKTDF